jgi:tetratricopeptide (TPR) repeat protein
MEPSPRTGSVPSVLRWLRRDWVLGAILIVSVFLAYLPVWSAGYVWDDRLVLTANPVIVGPLGLKEIWTTGAADICPLTLTTFWFEHALWGLNPLPYHLVNVLLHSACAVVLWQLLKSLRVPGAWFGAALWALHPVEVESVAWITEMKNTESGLFYLLSIFFFVRSRSGSRPEKRMAYVLMLLFAAMAMASKSSTVILPVVLCLCAWWMEGRWNWRRLIELVPVFLMSVVTGVFSLWSQGLRMATASETAAIPTWAERLATAGHAVWFYLSKLLWPYPLITIYPRWQVDSSAAISYLPFLAVLLILLILWLNRASWARLWFFAFAYFLVALFPVLGFIDLGYFNNAQVADHFQYLASMVPLALLGAGMVAGADHFLRVQPGLRPLLAVVLLSVLGILSWRQAGIYHDEVTLWSFVIARNPTCWIAYDNLGNALAQRGEIEAGMAQLQKALELGPDNPVCATLHCDLGNILLQKGEISNATDQYRVALAIKPNYAAAHGNLGNALLQLGEPDDAIPELQRAIALQPDYAAAHYNLGNAFARTLQLDEAVDEYRKALVLMPSLIGAHHNLGEILLRKGNVNGAILEFEKIVQLNPGDRRAQADLFDARAAVPQAPASR